MSAHIMDWVQVGKHDFYRKTDLYSMGWGGGFNLKDFLMSAAPLGGPIALMRDESKLTTSINTKPIIFIFSCSGKKISSFKWNSGNLIHIGWSRSEELVCVQDDGAVLLYDIFGTYLRTFNLGQEVKETRIERAEVFVSYQDTGVAVVTRAKRIFVVNNIKEPRTRKYSDIPGSTFTCWIALRKERSTSILVSQEDGLFLCSQDQPPKELILEWNKPREKVVAMAISTSARHIALFSNSGNIWIGSSDLCNKYIEYETKSENRPKQMMWCGTGAISLLWDMSLEIITVNGEVSPFYLDSSSYLIQERDSLRIISGLTHEIIQKVPQVLVETLGICSMSPGGLLFEASNHVQEGSTQANTFLGLIKNLEDAVIQCFHSAQNEFNPSTQKALLRAAFLGKTLVPEMDPEIGRKITNKLRILNAVRDHRVGIPLTWNQLDIMTIPVLLDRLVYRRLFPLSLRIASYLKLQESEGTSRILAHWACYKVKQPSQKNDDQIAKEINSKLVYTPGISYTDIAKKADEVGRKALAIKLIEYECRASRQVPVLLSLEEDQTALKRAVQSGDSNLIYTVLHHLRSKLPLAQFLMMIRNFPVAQSLYMKSCRDTDQDQLRDILVQEDDFYGQALLRIKEAYQSNRVDSQLASLKGASDCFRKAKNELGQQMTDDQIKLLKHQISLEEIHRKNYVNKSLHDSMYQLVVDGFMNDAEKLRSEFKVPEKRYLWLRLLAHAESSNWAELSNLSKMKKLPFGYEPFVEACLKFNNKVEAQKYLTKVKDENKVKYFLNCGLLEEAFKIAQEQRRSSALEEVASACGHQNQAILVKVQNLLKEPNLEP